MSVHQPTKTRRILLLTTPKSYRTPAFLEAARCLGIEVRQAVDMPRELAELWGYSLGVDFRDVEAAAQRLAAYVAEWPVDAILAVDDSGAELAARAAALAGLPHNHPQAAVAARRKDRMRALMSAAGVPSPAFLPLETTMPRETVIAQVETHIGYPCVVKPTDLNGSRGVIRADDRAQLHTALDRLLGLIGREPGQRFLVERYVPGFEVALEGLLDGGELQVLALFDKPDPLEGPFFEETIYVTPSRLPQATQDAIARVTAQAARALGLEMGPVHAELRVNEVGPWIVEIAGRSIGGLCSRILRFGTDHSLEELILAQACGIPLQDTARQGRAGGVMMIPIPEAGILEAVEGIDRAKAVPGVEDVQITARLNYPITPLPEGDAYLGFIFAWGETPEEVEAALREAHRRLQIRIKPEIPLWPRGGVGEKAKG